MAAYAEDGLSVGSSAILCIFMQIKSQSEHYILNCAARSLTDELGISYPTISTEYRGGLSPVSLKAMP